MHFGHITNPGNDLLDELEKFRSLGFDFVEIAIEPPEAHRELLEAARKTLKKRLGEFPAPPTAHAPFWSELGTPDITTRASWLLEIKKMIDICSSLGICKLTIHSGSASLFAMIKPVRPTIINNIISSFSYLVHHGKEKGVQVNIENTWEPPEDMSKILKGVPGLGLTFDISHAFILDGIFNIREYIRMFRKKINHIHIHDSRTGDDHKPIGQGKINFISISNMLKSIENPTVCLEVFGNMDENKKSLAKAKQIFGQVNPAHK